MDQISPQIVASNEPTPNDLNSLIRTVTMLSERVGTLEEENNELRKTTTRLESKFTNLESGVRRLGRDIDTLELNLKELMETVDDQQELVSSLSKSTSEARQDVNSLHQRLDTDRGEVERRISEVTQRVRGLELHLDVEDDDYIPQNSGYLDPDASVVEQLASMTEEQRKNLDPSKPLQRAVIVWENFDSWAKYVPSGYTITSGDLRKHLTAPVGRQLHWAEVYAVMEAFDENSPERFTYKDTKSKGKCLIKYHSHKKY